MNLLDNFTRMHYRTVITLLVLITVRLVKTGSAQDKKHFGCRPDGFNASRLFETVFDKYVERNKQDQDGGLVNCLNFTSRFVLKLGSDVFNSTLSFHKVTVDALSRLDKVYNVTSLAEPDDVVVSKAWISCREVVIRFWHVDPSQYFISDCGSIRAYEPHVSVQVLYDFERKAMELLWARFGLMKYLRTSFNIPMRSEYQQFHDQLGEMLYNRFLTFDKQIVDDVMYDRFQIALNASGIANVLDMKLRTRTRGP